MEKQDRLVMVSYDVKSQKRSLRSKVHRMIYGYTSVKDNGAVRRSYRYRGFSDSPGFRYIGQSVVALLPIEARKLTKRLEALHIKYSATKVLFLS